MQATTSIYPDVRTWRVFHFLKRNLEPRLGLPWPDCRSHYYAAPMPCDFELAAQLVWELHNIWRYDFDEFPGAGGKHGAERICYAVR